MRYFLGFLAAIGLIVVVFILILRGFGSKGAPQNQVVLADFSKSNTVVQLTVDGPINADQLHQRYRITIGRVESTIELIQGYEGNVIATKTYANNSEAYANFLQGLQTLGFTKGKDDPANADERGQCPDGDRFVYEIIAGGKKVQRFWSTSCGGGTFSGNNTKIRSLFTRQIPDFAAVTRDFRY